VDIRRFGTFNGNKQWLRDRVGEVLGLHYAIPWPNREFQTARPFRRSPVHQLVEDAGACFGSRMGWERPNFFAPAGVEPAIEYSWGKQNWIPWVDAEQRATREAVAMYDQTSFGKLLIQGPDAEVVLQWLCTADVAVPVGRAVYTGVLNARGTYEADVTVTRLAHDEYLWVTSSASVVRDRDWIVKHVGAEQDVTVTDVTGALAVLGVMGPKSRALLQSLSTSDLSADAFPFGTSREIDLGSTTVRATRITYVGELGWELYVPAEFAVSVFSMLSSKGQEFELAHAGYYAIAALRLEKGYRAFGTELTPDYNPVEAGLLFATKLKTSIPFLGREAVEAARAAGVKRRLVSFALEDPDIMMWGGELVLRDGQGSGQVTGAAFGTTVGSCVGLAYVWHPDGAVVTDEYLADGEWTINVGGTMARARVQRGSLYDPKSERIRS
jgi:4-methylaminobutanoate oxidase (formaldehyde-forming)